jgi:small acid-soluble spore protein A (major alpha-type SASP)
MESQGKKNGSNDVLVPEAKEALDKMKLEIAGEQALNVPNNDYWGNVPSKECGRVGGLIGGKMVREMVRLAEQQIKTNSR